MRLSLLMMVVLFLIAGPLMVWAQDGVKVSETGPGVEPSAILEIESTKEGMQVQKKSSVDSVLSQDQRDMLRKVFDEVKKHVGPSQARDLGSATTMAELRAKIALYVKACAHCEQLKALEASLKTRSTQSSKKN